MTDEWAWVRAFLAWVSTVGACAAATEGRWWMAAVNAAFALLWVYRLLVTGQRSQEVVAVAAVVTIALGLLVGLVVDSHGWALG